MAAQDTPEVERASLVRAPLERAVRLVRERHLHRRERARDGRHAGVERRPLARVELAHHQLVQSGEKSCCISSRPSPYRSMSTRARA